MFGAGDSLITKEFETTPPTGVEFVSGRVYALAGRRLSVRADAEWADKVAESFLGGFHLTPCPEETDASAADLRIHIRTDDPPALPSGLREFEIPGGTCSAGPDEYYLDVQGSRVAVEAKAARRVSVWLGGPARERRRGALITVMAYALPAALRRLGFYDLHAAGMVEPSSGSGFLFPGASNSGKTSLAIRLASAGWLYQTDDLLVLSEGEGGIEARGLRRPFQTSATSVAGCELPRLEDALGATIFNDPDKRRLAPEILFPGRFAASSRPRVICFPSITDEAESRLRRVGHPEAMSKLIAMCPWASYDASGARHHLRVLSRLVAQCRAYTLDAGRDIFEDQHAAGRLLASCI